MFIAGTMSCRTQEEFDAVYGALSGLPVDIAVYDLNIAVEYEPDDKQTEREAEIIAARLVDIIESVSEHGISQMIERG